jgi:Zn-dependent peptidase ImmA (M78 family)
MAKIDEITINIKWLKHLVYYIIEAIIVLSVVIFGVHFFNTMPVLKPMDIANSMAVANSFMVFVTFIFVVATVGITLAGMYFTRWWSREKKQVLKDNWSEMINLVKEDSRLMTQLKEDLFSDTLEEMMEKHIIEHREDLKSLITKEIKELEERLNSNSKSQKDGVFISLEDTKKITLSAGKSKVMKNYEAFRQKRISAPTLHAILEKSNMPFHIPIDIEKLINFLDIKIENKPDFTKMKVLGSIRIENDEPIIWINKTANQLNERRRFTLAHELGHYMFHLAPLASWRNDETFIDEKIGFNRDDEWDHREMEANGFAAQLLMPADIIKDRVNSCSKKNQPLDIEKISNEFKVSKVAMKYRLKSLGIEF